MLVARIVSDVYDSLPVLGMNVASRASDHQTRTIGETSTAYMTCPTRVSKNGVR